MAAAWELPVALSGGTRAMRDAGRQYLPQEPKEGNTSYENRLSRTTLFNGYKRTVRILGGMPFGKPVVLNEETSEPFVGMADDVDLAGRDLTAFTRDLMTDILDFGKAHILVDFPPPVLGEDGKPINLNLQEERELNRQPYFTQVSPMNLIGWRGERVGGVETLSRIRISETDTEPVGNWGEKKVNRVRVMTPTEIQIWVKEEEEWKLESTLPNTLGEIPLVTIYGNRTGFLKSLPTLEDLAWLNLRHWQSQSDQDNILHVARVPILFGAGFQKGDLDGAEIGGSRAISTPNPDAKLSYVEHSGAAISAGRQDTQDLEARMQVMGAELLVAKPGNQTATARSIDAAESMSDLQVMVRALETGLEQAFQFAGQWLQLGEAVASVDISNDFGLSLKEAGDLQTLLQSRLAGELSQRTYLSEIKRRGILSDSTNIEDEITAIKTEPPPGLTVAED